MRPLRNIWVVLVVALVVSMACTRSTDERVESTAESDGTAQIATDPGEETGTMQDPPNITDFMDATTTKQFEEMNSEWQEMVREGWIAIIKLTPRKDWAEAAQDAVSQSYAQAKIQGGVLGVSVGRVHDIADPSKGTLPAGASPPPFVLTLLSPGYTEAYDLIPEGSLMREYLDIKLRRFTEKGWESVKAQPDEPYSMPVPKLGTGDEFEIRRMLTSAGDAEWLVRRLRTLDEDVARQYEGTEDVTERLAVFRKLVEVHGKGQVVKEILAEWGARSNGLDEEKVAAFVERTRIRAAEIQARNQMTPRQQYTNHVESILCGALMTHIVGQEPRSANSSPGQCDIANVIDLTKEALEAGRPSSSEPELREAVAAARQSVDR